MITNFFTTTFTVSRSEWTQDEEENPQSSESEVATFKGHLQQANASLVQNLGLSLTTSFAVWCLPSADVRAGDTISDGSRSFSVRAVMSYLDGGNAHLELIVELDEVEVEEES